MIRGSFLCGGVRVPAGLLDDDPGLAIGGHIFVGSKAPWDEIGGSAPRFEERPIPSAQG